MPRYLLSLYRPAGYNPALAEDASVRQAIDEVNAAMVGAGVRRFVGGLHPIGEAHSIQPAADGTWIERPEPYLDAPSHVGGFWVIEVPDLATARAWAHRAAAACRGGIEVRAFH